jgi:hypothetical protein
MTDTSVSFAAQTTGATSAKSGSQGIVSPPAHFQSFLVRLVASKALTQFQTDWLEAIWPNLDADAFAHPYLQSLREHTRAMLERG